MAIADLGVIEICCALDSLSVLKLLRRDWKKRIVCQHVESNDDANGWHVKGYDGPSCYILRRCNTRAVVSGEIV